MTLPVSNKQSRLGHVVVHRGIAQSRGPGTGLCISAAPDQAWVSPVPQNKQMSAERVYGVGEGILAAFASQLLVGEGSPSQEAGPAVSC